MASQFGLRFMAGAAFDRTVMEEERERVTERRDAAGRVTMTTEPEPAWRTVSNHVAATVGIEAPVRLGERLFVSPGLRFSGVSSGWSLRPAIALGWTF